MNRVKQAPVRNASVLGAHVYSHSGEFAPEVTDVTLPGRGPSFTFVRKYRSARHDDETGELGRGWTFAYAKRLVGDGRDVLYHDGFGRVHRFTASGRLRYGSPNGFYSVLARRAARMVLTQRYGESLVFASPERGGRLLALRDRNGNTLAFRYQSDGVRITDALGREVRLALAGGRIVECRDHTRRAWNYRYDEAGCLVEVLQPPPARGASRPTTRYTYDEHHRLASVTDPNGQEFLRNYYDDAGRVVRQEHGRGLVTFAYTPLATLPDGTEQLRTEVVMKNGARLTVAHDVDGHRTEHVLLASAESLAQDQAAPVSGAVVPLTTRSRFNAHGELVERSFPAGNRIVQVFDDAHPDTRARGNLLQVTRHAAGGVEGDQDELTTAYTYEPAFQQVTAAVDPRGARAEWTYDRRGNLASLMYPPVTNPAPDPMGGATPEMTRLVERFVYNAAGQLVRRTDARGARTDFFYYPASSPGGRSGRRPRRGLTQRPGGLLAREVVDVGYPRRPLKAPPARLSREYAYDAVGAVTDAFDGRGARTSFTRDALGRVVEIEPRDRAAGLTRLRYDANGNLIERVRAFERSVSEAGVVLPRPTVLHETREYSVLNNLLTQVVEADGAWKILSIGRDEAEQVVRRVSPGGEVTEYAYDERGLMTMVRSGARTPAETTTRHAYSPNGRLTLTTDGEGRRTRHVLDGFDRVRGSIAPDGTVTRRWLDPLGHVVRVAVDGRPGSGASGTETRVPLLESFFEHDELGRLVRVDRAWRDPASGEPLGESVVDGRPGVASRIFRYNGGHRVSAVWSESSDVVSLEYDGAGRVTSVGDGTGEQLLMEYDSNGNARRIERRGPRNGEGAPLRVRVEQVFDAMDRVVSRGVRGEARVRYGYDALGLASTITDERRAVTTILRDGFGRPVSRIRTLDARENDGRGGRLVERLAWDGGDRRVAWTNASGHVTRYQYDALGRLASVTLADGTAHHVVRDGAGNVVTSVDARGVRVHNRYDAANRLVGRDIEDGSGRRELARLSYDAAGRLLTATVDGTTIERRYDTRSCLLSETQGERTLEYTRDAAGRCIALRYPGGLSVQRLLDRQGRLLEVRDTHGRVLQCRYRAATQLSTRRLGEALDTTFVYDRKFDRLASVSYRARATGALVLESSLGYDDTGVLASVRQATPSSVRLDEYAYDDARRLTRASCAMRSAGGSERADSTEETRFDLAPTGPWLAESTRSSDGRNAHRRAVLDVLERYAAAGDGRFEHDANGNRVLEERDGGRRRRLRYDHANRIIEAESVAADRSVRTVQYTYDLFGRVLTKRVSGGENAGEHSFTWDGTRPIEHWSDGRLAHSFVHGESRSDPVKLYRHADGQRDALFVLRDGAGNVSALVDSAAAVVEQYRYDVRGQPVAAPGFSVRSEAGNLFGASGAIWDADLQAYTLMGRSWDTFTGASFDVGSGLVDLEPLQGTPPPDSELAGIEIFVGFGLVAIGFIIEGVGFVLLPGGWIFTPPAWLWGGIIVIGAGLIIDGASGSPGANWLLDKLGLGSKGPSGKGRGGFGTGSSTGSAGGTTGGAGSGAGSGSGSGDGWGDSGGGPPGDRPSKDDYGSGSGSSGGGGSAGGSGSGSGTGGGTGGGSTTPSGSSTGSSGGQKEHKPVLNNDGQWVYEDTGEPVSDDDKKDKGASGGGGNGSMGNPEEGTDEGIDKDWWRDLPYRSGFDVALELKYGPRVDDPENVPGFNYAAAAGRSLASVLAPGPLTVDERGEGVHFDLSRVQGDPSARGTSTTDGWGDKPRSWAESLAAPRIRDPMRARF